MNIELLNLIKELYLYITFIKDLMYEFTFDNKVKVGIFKDLDIDFSRFLFYYKIKLKKGVV